jgi:hypothetical protein
MFLENYFIGLGLVLIVYFLSIFLSLVLPGKTINGYVLRESGKHDLLCYKCNGWRVFFVSVVILVLIFPRFFVLVCDYFKEYFLASNTLGLSISLAYYLKGRNLEKKGKILKSFRAPTVDTGF